MCGLRDLLFWETCGLRDLLLLRAVGHRGLDTLALDRLRLLDLCVLLVLASRPGSSVSTHLTTRKWDRLASGRDWIGIWVPSLGTRTERGPTWGCQCSLLLSSGFPRPGSEMSSEAGLLKGSSGALEPELGSDWQPELSLSTNFCAPCTERQVGNTHKELISAVEIGRGGVC